MQIISPCQTFNRRETFAFYKPRVRIYEDPPKSEICAVYPLIFEDPEHDRLGILYQVERPTFDGAMEEVATEARRLLQNARDQL